MFTVVKQKVLLSSIVKYKIVNYGEQVKMVNELTNVPQII